MLPGRRYNSEDLLRILRERIWLLLLPFAMVAAATATVARRLPNQYVSQATILVVPQQVPESYVKSGITTRIEDRVRAAYQQISSRSRLERIVEEFGLYARERRTGIMEDIIANMRKNIAVQVIRTDAFTVSFQGSDPKTVQKVADRLATSFVDQNLRDREVLADGTNQFLEVQLEDARRTLIEQEKKLEEYNTRFAGQLPSQLNANLQALQRVQLQIQSTVESINRDGNSRIIIQRQLEEAQNEPPVAAADAPAPRPDSASPDSPASPPGGSAAQRLALARSQLAAMQQQGKKGDHPDVIAMNHLIRDLSQQADAEALAQPVSVATAATATDETKLPPAEVARRKRIQVLEAQKAQLNQQIAASQADEARLRSVAADYQKKVDGVPARESELTELTRDYGTLQTMYRSLLTKKEDAAISSNLEKRQFGEQFKMTDPAQLPEVPTSPNRPVIDYMGMAAGLAVGVLLVALLEYRNSGFQTDDDVTRLTALPVLAVVPLMQSDAEVRQRRWRSLLIGLGLGSAVLGCVVVFAYAVAR